MTESNQNKPDPKRAAKAYVRQGRTLKDSFIEAGYSPAQAKKGMGLLAERPGIAKAFAEERQRAVRKLAALGSALTPQEQEHLVRGALLDETLKGDSRQRVRAAELLGKDRRCQFFSPEVEINVAALNMPADFVWPDEFDRQQQEEREKRAQREQEGGRDEQ
jgi:hypothetical protein